MSRCPSEFIAWFDGVSHVVRCQRDAGHPVDDGVVEFHVHERRWIDGEDVTSVDVDDENDAPAAPPGSSAELANAARSYVAVRSTSDGWQLTHHYAKRWSWVGWQAVAREAGLEHGPTATQTRDALQLVEQLALEETTRAAIESLRSLPLEDRAKLLGLTRVGSYHAHPKLHRANHEGCRRVPTFADLSHQGALDDDEKELRGE